MGIVLVASLGALWASPFARNNVALVSAVHALDRAPDVTASARLDMAEGSLRRRLDVSPHEMVLWRALGLVLDAQQRPQAALEAWSSDPASTNLLLNRGLLAEYGEDFDWALKWYGYASELAPAMAEPWYRLAIVHEAQGDLPVAETHLRQAVHNEPDNRDYWFALGRVLAQQEREQAALEAYEQAATAQKGRVGRSAPLYQVGRLAERMEVEGGFVQAEQAYLEAIALDDFAVVPHWRALPHYRLGEVYLEREQYAEALEQYEKALAINHDLYEARLGRAKTLMEMARIGEAQQALQVLIDSNPERAAAYWQLARLYELQGDDDRAQELRSQAATLSSE